jgi:hypothetical protein
MVAPSSDGFAGVRYPARSPPKRGPERFPCGSYGKASPTKWSPMVWLIVLLLVGLFGAFAGRTA